MAGGRRSLEPPVPGRPPKKSSKVRGPRGHGWLFCSAWDGASSDDTGPPGTSELSYSCPEEKGFPFTTALAGSAAASDTRDPASSCFVSRVTAWPC